jgi:hypothetical protein
MDWEDYVVLSGLVGGKTRSNLRIRWSICSVKNFEQIAETKLANSRSSTFNLWQFGIPGNSAPGD